MTFFPNSILFDERSINSQFNNESEERLLKELEAYRKFCIDNYQSLINEINYDSSFWKYLPRLQIRQSAYLSKPRFISTNLLFLIQYLN